MSSGAAPPSAAPHVEPAAARAARASVPGWLRATPPYLLGAGVALLTFALRVLLSRLLGYEAPDVLLIPAVVAVALAWGVRAALASALVGVVATALWLASPSVPTALHWDELTSGLIVFITATLVGIVAGRLREAELRAVERARDALLARQNAEWAAAESEANERRYRALFRSMGEGFALHQLVFDARGDACDYRFIEVNPAFERLTGLRREDVEGRLKSEVLPGDDPQWLQIYAEVAITGRPVCFESRSSALDREFEVYAACPAPNQFTTILRDVTVRRQMERALRESEQHHRLLFETMTQGVVYQDAGGRTLAMNAAAERILGRAHELAGEGSLGERPLPAVREDGTPFPEEEQPAMVALRLGQPLSGVTMGVRNPRDGARHWIEVSAVPLFRENEQRPYQVYTLLADVTERKRAEDALRASEQRHRELAEELRESDQRKNDFLAVLSHELRNPLAPVRNSLYVLERVEPGSGQARHALQVIARQVGQLAQIVDDLLDLTRISRGKVQLRLETLDLGQVLRRTVDDHRPVFEQARVVLRTTLPEAPVWACVDRTRVAQIVGNLLGNAMKFTPPAGEVALELAATEQEASIRVSDTGVGIEPEVLERLFQPFAQGQQTLERSQGGLGLGLTLVKAFAEMQGGRVRAASEGRGTGATFTLTLPVVTAPVRAAAASSPAPCAVRRVLVVEDREDAAASLCEALRLMGHEVARAASGLEAVELARERRPDVVICDIGLPGIDGYEVARRLRGEPATAQALLWRSPATRWRRTARRREQQASTRIWQSRPTSRPLRGCSPSRRGSFVASTTESSASRKVRFVDTSRAGL